ncbi:MAG: hypothetical protein RI897_1814 [Verrucomicrobiota bacterium]
MKVGGVVCWMRRMELVGWPDSVISSWGLCVVEIVVVLVVW